LLPLWKEGLPALLAQFRAALSLGFILPYLKAHQHSQCQVVPFFIILWLYADGRKLFFPAQMD
jgi:hypothetical protein